MRYMSSGGGIEETTNKILAMTTPVPFLDICIGDEASHNEQLEVYQVACELVTKNAKIYGFPERPELLSDEQREMLQEIHVRPHTA